MKHIYERIAQLFEFNTLKGLYLHAKQKGLIDETENINKLYTSKGIKPPEGKGIHTKKFHEIATAIMDKGKSKDSAYAIAMSQLGKKKAVKKAHQQNEDSTPDVTKLPIIGYIITKEMAGMPSEKLAVVDIADTHSGKIYIRNEWYKEHNKIPYIVHEKMVDRFIPNPTVKEADEIEPEIVNPNSPSNHLRQNDEIASVVLQRIFGLSPDNADDVIQQSKDPEVKKQMKGASMFILVDKYGLSYEEAKDFVEKYYDAPIKDMLQGMMDVIQKQGQIELDTTDIAGLLGN